MSWEKILKNDEATEWVFNSLQKNMIINLGDTLELIVELTKMSLGNPIPSDAKIAIYEHIKEIIDDLWQVIETDPQFIRDLEDAGYTLSDFGWSEVNDMLWPLVKQKLDELV